MCFWHWTGVNQAPALLVCQGGRAEIPLIAFADPAKEIGIVVNSPGGGAEREAVAFFHHRGIHRIAELHFTRSRIGAVAGLHVLTRQMAVDLAVLPERDRYSRRFEERCREIAESMPEIRWKESGGWIRKEAQGVIACGDHPAVWQMCPGENGRWTIHWRGREFLRKTGAGNRLECTIYE